MCQYYLRGTCKFGNSCRNEHPRDGQRQGGFGSACIVLPHKSLRLTLNCYCACLNYAWTSLWRDHARPVMDGLWRRNPNLCNCNHRHPIHVRVSCFSLTATCLTSPWGFCHGNIQHRIYHTGPRERETSMATIILRSREDAAYLDRRFGRIYGGVACESYAGGEGGDNTRLRTSIDISFRRYLGTS